MFNLKFDGGRVILRLFSKDSKGGIKITFRNPFIQFMNKIFLVDKNGKAKRVFRIKNLKIRFEGTGSKIYIHKPVKFRGKSQIICASDVNITIKGARDRMRDFDLRISSGSSFYIGKGFSCGGMTTFISSKEKLNVHIGDDCLFSNDIVLMVSDGHKIFNKYDENKTPINKPEDITIGDHVWVGYGVMLLKGSKIANNSIVGAKALVNKKFSEENIIIAGMPAKKIKENINWAHEF